MFPSRKTELLLLVEMVYITAKTKLKVLVNTKTEENAALL